MSDEPRSPEQYEPPAVEEVTGMFPTVSTAPGATRGGSDDFDDSGPEGK
jgi:hypothetical protein